MSSLTSKLVPALATWLVFFRTHENGTKSSTSPHIPLGMRLDLAQPCAHVYFGPKSIIYHVEYCPSSIIIARILLSQIIPKNEQSSKCPILFSFSSTTSICAYTT